MFFSVCVSHSTQPTRSEYEDPHRGKLVKLHSLHIHSRMFPSPAESLMIVTIKSSPSSAGGSLQTCFWALHVTVMLDVCACVRVHVCWLSLTMARLVICFYDREESLHCRYEGEYSPSPEKGKKAVD